LNSIVHPGSASNEPGLLKTVKLIPSDKNRLKAVETVKKEKNYSTPRSDDFVSRISTGTREPKTKIDTGKLIGKTDLHPLELTLTGEKDGFENGNNKKFESFSRCLNSFTGEYETDTEQGVQGSVQEEKKTTQIDDRNGNMHFTFTSDNFSATDDYECDEYSDNGENRNSKKSRANVDKISCTEIERLRILQLLREHDLKNRLQEEGRVLEERRRAKKILANSAVHAIKFQTKKKIPFSGYNHAPPRIEKPLKMIPKYPPTPDYSKIEHISFLHQPAHRNKQEVNNENSEIDAHDLTDPTTRNENSIVELNGTLNAEVIVNASVTPKRDNECDSAMTTARTSSVDTARTDTAGVAVVRTDSISARTDKGPVPVSTPVPPAVSESHYTYTGSAAMGVGVAGGSTSNRDGISVPLPATAVTAEASRYASGRIATAHSLLRTHTNITSSVECFHFPFGLIIHQSPHIVYSATVLSVTIHQKN
jgi:hypothetical protein